MKDLEVGCTVLVVQRNRPDDLWGAVAEGRCTALAPHGWARVRYHWWWRAAWLPIDGPFTKLLRVETA